MEIAVNETIVCVCAIVGVDNVVVGELTSGCHIGQRSADVCQRASDNLPEAINVLVVQIAGIRLQDVVNIFFTNFGKSVNDNGGRATEDIPCMVANRVGDVPVLVVTVTVFLGNEVESVLLASSGKLVHNHNLKGFVDQAFDAPLTEDGDDTLLELIPCSQGADLVELQELQSIVRMAVDHIKDINARDIIRAVYWKGESITDYAERNGISRQTANEWLQNGYTILRQNKRIISLAIAYGYDTDYYRYKGLSAFRSDGTSAVEDAVILQDARKRQREALYRQLGGLVEIYTDRLIDK